MERIKKNTDKLSYEIIYKILEYNDDYTVKIIGDRIIIYEPKYKLILNCLNKLCSVTDKCSVKSWRFFNHCCMKVLYKKCNHHDFHLLLRELKHIDLFINIKTANIRHHLYMRYYHTLNYIYKTNYPVINKEDSRLLYGLFWDYCKFYFLIYKKDWTQERIYFLI
jgi:hypothetical protein